MRERGKKLILLDLSAPRNIEPSIEDIENVYLYDLDHLYAISSHNKQNNNEKLEKVKTVSYKNNYGYLFSSGPNTWHGMEKKDIVKERRCLQVNYVTFPTDWKVE